MPAHWFDSPTKVRNDFGEITERVAPNPTHAESMVRGMGYEEAFGILHDTAVYCYEGDKPFESPRNKDCCHTRKVAGIMRAPPKTKTSITANR
jgi:hypothetical protein